LRFICMRFFLQGNYRAPALLVSHAALDSFIEFLDEQLVVERLPQEGERTCLRRPFTQTHRVVGAIYRHRPAMRARRTTAKRA
jgi:hypothetical protein